MSVRVFTWPHVAVTRLPNGQYGRPDLSAVLWNLQNKLGSGSNVFPETFHHKQTNLLLQLGFCVFFSVIPLIFSISWIRLHKSEFTYWTSTMSPKQIVLIITSSERLWPRRLAVTLWSNSLFSGVFLLLNTSHRLTGAKTECYILSFMVNGG